MASGSLIYADESLINIPGDAVVTVTYKPKSFSNPYGTDFVYLLCSPSWAEAEGDDDRNYSISLPVETIAGGNLLTIQLASYTFYIEGDGAIHEYFPEVTASVEIQQAGVAGIFSTQVQLETQYLDEEAIEAHSVTVQISTSGNRITGVG